jgi:hypothetical protein
MLRPNKTTGRAWPFHTRRTATPIAARPCTCGRGFLYPAARFEINVPNTCVKTGDSFCRPSRSNSLSTPLSIFSPPPPFSFSRGDRFSPPRPDAFSFFSFSSRAQKRGASVSRRVRACLPLLAAPADDIFTQHCVCALALAVASLFFYSAQRAASRAADAAVARARTRRARPRKRLDAAHSSC